MLPRIQQAQIQHLRRVLLALSAAAVTGVLAGCLPAAEASTPSTPRPATTRPPAPDGDGFYQSDKFDHD